MNKEHIEMLARLAHGVIRANYESSKAMPKPESKPWCWQSNEWQSLSKTDKEMLMRFVQLVLDGSPVGMYYPCENELFKSAVIGGMAIIKAMGVGHE